MEQDTDHAKDQSSHRRTYAVTREAGKVDSTKSTSAIRMGQGSGKSSKPSLGGCSPSFGSKISLNRMLRYEMAADSSDSLMQSDVSSPTAPPNPMKGPLRVGRRPNTSKALYSGGGGKDRHINSNFRFFLSPSSSPITSPDDPVEWGRVVAAMVPMIPSNPSVCPICLDCPVLPRLTQCGHVFCWLCLLRYATLTEPTTGQSKWWRACPICWEDFHYGQVKPVEYIPQIDPVLALKEGWPVTFLLFKRNSADFHLECLEDGKRSFDRCQMVTSEQVKAWQEEDRNGLLALSLDLEPESMDSQLIRQVLERSEDPSPKLMGLEETPSCKASHLSSASSPPVWFHQAEDGQQLFLHPLSIKILKRHFGSYEQLPRRLECRLVDIEWDVLRTPDDRKRLKQLCHLPIGTHFGLCEVDLSSIVPPQVIQEYQKETASRQRFREARKREEEASLTAFHRAEREKLQEAIHDEGVFIESAFLTSNGPFVGGPVSMLQDYVNFPPPPSEAIPIIQNTGEQTNSGGSGMPSPPLATSFASIISGSPSEASEITGKRKKKGILVFNSTASSQRSLR